MQVFGQEDLVTQFTEDAFTKEDHVCQQSKCQVPIQKGNPCHYIAAYNPAQPSKFVCGACYQWYKNKPATTAHAQNTNAYTPISLVNPPPIIAMLPNLGNFPAHMPPSLPAPHYNVTPASEPPPSVHSQHHPTPLPHALPYSRPAVHVPSTWNKDAWSAPPTAPPAGLGHAMALPLGSTGYGRQHLHYATQHEHWACMAQHPPPAETISLEILAVFEAGGKRKNNICEGLKDIDAQSSAHKLASTVLKMVVPHIKAYSLQFPCKWVDLTKHTSPLPYFYNNCLHPSNQKGSKAVAFKSKQFTLFVIVPKCLTPAAPPPVLMSQPSTPLFLSDGQTISTTSSIFDRPISQDACVQDNSNNVSTTSIKHHHHYSSSTSSGSTPLLPQKKHVLTAFSSPDHYQLKEVLQLEGASEFDVVKVFQQQIVQVDFYPILTCSLNELISTQTSFDIQTTDLFSGNIRLDLSRPYIDNIADPGPPFIHLTLKDESKQLYTEANALYWAKSLLQMTYEFVDTAVKAAQAPPPFQIPCLHFVDAGLLLAYEPHVATVATAKPPKPGGTVSTMFLAEELIPASEGDFMKYIHNSDATPCDLFDTKADKIAQFLSFTQHVQYSKTGGQVYISDYQGSGLLLTDPQILTHP
ncbi:hypothetical protein V8B97DRAFT_1919298 [Scleroderma yunnanense]